MTTILTKKKDTAGAPAPGDLTNAAGGAELAVNTATKRLYSKDSAGAIIEIGTNASSSTIDALTVTTSATLSYGTANQIQFLNASKILTGAAGLTWDGTSLTASNYVSAGNITVNTNKFTVAGSTGNTLIGGTATVNTLTSGRVTFAGASGLLSDSANLTWNGSSLAVTGTVAVTGALTATLDSTFSSTGALSISKGTTAERPTPASGMLRFNTTTTEFEGYNGSAWASVGGAALSNDTSTASNLFPLFATATSGTASTLNTSNAKLLYKPSTGELQASVPVALNGIVVNSQTVATSYTIAAGYSGMSAGPVTVASGQSVTVSSGSRWVVQ
jgi:hypothetical protein